MKIDTKLSILILGFDLSLNVLNHKEKPGIDNITTDLRGCQRGHLKGFYILAIFRQF